jgi:hypothetical protein
VGIEPTMACGDGYVDRNAGEECDPKDPAREFESACEGTNRPDGIAACDPDDCTIINTPDQCASCGDLEIDPGAGEVCDGTVPTGVLCVNGADKVTCTDDCQLDYDSCPTCGNGKVDPPLEECDPFEAAGDITQTIYCSEVPSPYPKPFSYGVIVSCLGECRYDRTNCSFCGDGEIDGPTTPRSAPRKEGDPRMLAEKCDGDAAEAGALTAYCRKRCTGTEVGSLVLDCNFECAENCLAFEDVPDEELDCCVPPAETCPPDGSDYKCCWELVPENADSGDLPCIPHWVGNEMFSVCR